jgi:hypothetical protein
MVHGAIWEEHSESASAALAKRDSAIAAGGAVWNVATEMLLSMVTNHRQTRAEYRIGHRRPDGADEDAVGRDRRRRLSGGAVRGWGDY